MVGYGGICTPLGMVGYTGYIPPYVLPGIYHLVYTTLYHPGYTTIPTLLPGVPQFMPGPVCVAGRRGPGLQEEESPG